MEKKPERFGLEDGACIIDTYLLAGVPGEKSPGTPVDFHINIKLTALHVLTTTEMC